MENYALWIIIRRMRIPFLVIIVTFAISIIGLMMIEGVDDSGHPYKMNFFDAFYFVSYMASTIGFGEAPYTFTYPQRLWVSFCIYLTVIGWFYGIGTIVALIQDKTLAEELTRNRFKKNLKAISGDFILFLGYSKVTKEIIDRLNSYEHRIVVIDKDEDKINALELEGYNPVVPALKGDIEDSENLKFAGIKMENCKWIVSLLKDETKNVKLALMCKILNEKASVIVKATNKEYKEYLSNIGVENVIDPFKIISKRIYLAHTAISLWILERWVMTGVLHSKDLDKHLFPKGKYIVCSSGRMGRAISDGLKMAKISHTVLNIGCKEGDFNSGVFGDEEDLKLLEKSGVKEAAAIIAATRDDFINLMILKSARKINPDIFTIARENTLDDLSIFEAAHLNRNYILEEILIEKTYNYIAKPLANIFVKQITKKSEDWGKRLIERLLREVGENPKLYEIEITENEAYALFQRLKEGEKIKYEVILRDRGDWKRKAQLLILLLKRGKEIILQPDSKIDIHINDKLLIAATKESFYDFQYIVENYYELKYVMYGEDKAFKFFE